MILDLLDVCIIIAMYRLPQKQSVIIWRIASVFVILYGIAIIYNRQYMSGFASLFVTCFCFGPFIPNTMICSECGKKLYWRALLSNKCPKCKRNFIDPCYPDFHRRVNKDDT